MDLRKSFLKPFKRVKQKLKGGRRKRDGGSESENDRGGKETDAEGSEVSRRNSCLHSEVEGVVEGGPSLEENHVGGDGVGQVGSPPSAPSIPYNVEPSSM